MLALMGVAAGTSRATLVFDEVDAGIGGQTARAVGDQLRDLAAGRQVLCITHLPQIASLATRHFSIAKDALAQPRAHDRHPARATTRSSPSSCGCSAPTTRPTAPRAATPRSCCEPREGRSARPRGLRRVAGSGASGRLAGGVRALPAAAAPRPPAPRPRLRRPRRPPAPRRASGGRARVLDALARELRREAPAQLAVDVLAVGGQRLDEQAEHERAVVALLDAAHLGLLEDVVARVVELAWRRG